MLYGTAHDTLNGHGTGLASNGPGTRVRRTWKGTRRGAIPNLAGLRYPVTSTQRAAIYEFKIGDPANERFWMGTPTVDVPLECGIDPNGVVWIKYLNQYITDDKELKSISYAKDTPVKAIIDPNNTESAKVVPGGVGLANKLLQDAIASNSTIAGVVGYLRQKGVPFTAYAAPAAPTFSAPQASAPTTQSYTLSAPSAAELTASPYASLLSVSDQTRSALTIYSAEMFSVSDGSTLLSVYFDASESASNRALFQSVGNSWKAITQTQAEGLPLSNRRSLYPPSTPAPVSHALDIPDGYMRLDSLSMIAIQPIAGSILNINDNGTVSITGNPNLYGLLDPTKVSLGLYAWNEIGAGPITSPAGRTYNLTLIFVIDLYTRKVLGPYYVTREGGNAGGVFESVAPHILRAITDLGTFGLGEVVHLVSDDAGKKVDMIYGGATIAVMATVATGGAFGAALPALATAAAGAGVAGAAEGAINKDASQVITQALITGVVAGAGAALYTAATADPVAESVANPGAADSASGGAPGGASSGGETSLVPSQAVTPSATGSGSVSTAGSAISKAGAVLSKTAAATIVSTGVTALSTEIKKLTGQLPKAPQSPAASYSLVGQAPPTEQPGNPMLVWGLGALAALMLVKKHSS